MPKVSIIIPVYNAAQYLKDTLESLINQTLKDIEIICINDGSKDNSLDIVKGFAQNDNRFVIIDKQNEGVSIARNTGIDRASSDYIMFLDADDKFTPNACELAYEKICTDDADIGIFASSITKHLFDEIDNKNNIDYAQFQLICWDKIYKKSFLDKNNIRFKKGLKTGEDTAFCFLTMAEKPKYVMIDKVLYLYTISPNGASRNVHGLKTDLESFRYLFNQESIKNADDEFKFNIINMKSRNLLVWYKNKYKKQKKIIKKDVFNFVDFFLEQVKLDILRKQTNKQTYFSQLYQIYIAQKSFRILDCLDGVHKNLKIGPIKIKWKVKK